MNRARGNKTSQAERELRRQQVIEKLKNADEQTLTQLAEDLGVSRATLWRDLQAIEARYVAGSAEDVKQFKVAQYHALLKIEEATVKGTIEPDVSNALTRIREAVAKLLGLNAPMKSLSMRVKDVTDLAYLKFKSATAGLNEEQLEAAYASLRQIPRVRKPTVMDASWFPAPEPKLLGENADVTTQPDTGQGPGGSTDSDREGDRAIAGEAEERREP